MGYNITMDNSANGGQMHLDNSNIVHPAIVPLTTEEVAKFVLSEEKSLPILSSLDAAVSKALLDTKKDFIRMLVDALMADDPLPSNRTGKVHSGLGESVCRKHKHQPWCNRMRVLARYTRLAVNYHHARKRMRWEDHGHDFGTGANKSMGLICLYGELKAEARIKFYSSECDCPGLGPNDPYMDEEIDDFIREHKR